MALGGNMKTIGMIGGMSWESSTASYMMSYAPESFSRIPKKNIRLLSGAWLRRALKALYWAAPKSAC